MNNQVYKNNKVFTIHLLGLAHLATNAIYQSCAYTQKIRKLATMMKSLGHKVIFYGAEGSDVECDEFVQVVSKDTIKRTYGEYDWKKEMFKFGDNDEAHREFNRNAITEINKRKGKKDFLFATMGTHHQPIGDATGLMIIECGIGYYGIFSRFKVFESYAWMHHIYGFQGNKSVNLYDCVIPNYFDPNDFEYKTEKQDYFLYLGRLIPDKGIQIAKEACETANVKLKIAGQGDIKWLGESSNVEFVGFADREKRKELMANAKAILVPTLYIEPFGGVNVEAAFSGTPVISTDAGGFAETVVHGITGYRCHTLDQFVWAIENIDNIKPENCRNWAMANYTLDRCKWMYQEYLEMLYDLWDKGWYEMHEDKPNMDWLNRKYDFTSTYN